MNLKTTLLLIAVLAACGAGLWLTLRDNGEDSDPAEQAPIEQAELDQDLLGEAVFDRGLSRIALSLYGQDNTVVLTNRRGRWSVTEPHAFPANRAIYDELLSELDALAGRPMQQQTMQADPVGVRLSRGDETVSVWLGDRLGAGRGVVFIERGGQTRAYNAPDTLHDLLARLHKSMFYDSSIPPLLIPEIERIELTRGGATAALVQDGGRWWLEHDTGRVRVLAEPILNPDETVQHPGVANYFTQLRAIELTANEPYETPADLVRFGLDPPNFAVRFLRLGEDPADPAAGMALRVGATGPIITGYDGEPEQSRYISYAPAGDPMPPVFVIDHQYTAFYGEDGTHLRDPRITTLAPPLVDAVRLQSPGSDTITATFHDDDTVTRTVGDNSPMPQSPQAWAEALQNLNEPSAVSFVDPPTGDGFDLLLSVELAAAPGYADERFEVYSNPDLLPTNPTVLVRRGEEPVMLEVPSEVIAPLLDPDTFDPSTQDQAQPVPTP